MKKYQLTEDMAQDRKYWMTKILAGPAQEMVKKGEKVRIPMYLRLTTFTKTVPQNVISPIICLLFLFRSGAPPITLLTAGALTDPRLPATASNVCTTDARLGGVGRVPPPPPTKILATHCDSAV